MSFKKIISMISVVAILASIIVLPVCVEGASTSIALNDKFKYYIVKEDFDTDTGDWVLGEFLTTRSEATLERVDVDGVSALALKATRVDGSGAFLTAPNAYLDFEDIEFTPGNRIVIRMKFKQTGGSSASSYLKYNRPNSLNIKNSYVDANGTTVSAPAAAFMEDAMNLWTMLRFNAGNIQSDAGTFVEADTVNNWTEVEVTIDEGTKEYNVVTKTGNVTGTTSDNIVSNIWELQCFDGSVTEYDSLDSLTLYIRQNPNTLYVDYFEIYEERDYMIISSAALQNDYIRVTDALYLTLNTQCDFATLPEGAVYIEGVEADVTYDKDTRTVSLQPKEELAPGANHIVKVNAEILSEVAGISFEGETEYPFSVSDVAVKDIVATGRVIPGTTVVADYNYISTKPEGIHEYRWQVSETGQEDSFTDITGATNKSFVVTDNEYGKYLRLKIVPWGLNEAGENAYYGFEAFSNTIVPEKKPVISNLEISSDAVFVGSYLSAFYDFSDENGDEEGDSIVKWYISDSIAGEWSEVYTGKIFNVIEAYENKYIMCSVTPVSVSQKETVGVNVSSEAVGPVSDILKSTNMYTNPGFEDGVLGDWTYNANSAGQWPGIKIQTKETYEGDYAIELPNRQTVHDSYGQSVEVKGGVTYLFGVWATKPNKKVEDVTDFTVYTFSSNVDRGDTAAQYTYTLKNDWQLMVGSFIPQIDMTVRVGLVSFVARQNGLENAYLDNFYLGELVVGDIETYEKEVLKEDIVIPESGKKEITITSGKVLNQLGTQHGLWNETAKIRIPETKGVYVDGNKIVVTEEAIASKINAEVYCLPQYAGAKQSIFQKFIEINIVPHNNLAPKVTSIDVTGTVLTGSTLTGSYTFHQVNGKADASEIRWMFSDSEDGIYYNIPGATSCEYVVDGAYADKYIKFVVVPKTEDGIVGTEARSDALTKARVPVARNISVKGNFNVGNSVTGEYEFYDPNKDSEGVSTYKWYIADSLYGQYMPINGATDKTLVFTDEMINKYIKFGVTPVSVNAPKSGAEVLSNPYATPSVPVANDVTIYQDETRLVGSYNFSHVHNARETNTTYKWTVDGVTVSEKIDYLINFAGTKMVTFTVTPVSDSNPSKGVPVSVSVVVTGRNDVSGGNTGGSGGGFGGGSGGGGFTSGVTSVNDMQLGEKEAEVITSKSDIDNHWGKDYIKEMETRGVMKADEAGNFDPDKLVSRSEMITFLFDALKLEETEYISEFSDVSALDDYAGKLQTLINNGTIANYHEFRPNDTISREEMCKILYVSLENAGKLKKAETNVLDAFSDKDLISDWAVDYVNTIFANKIMIGTSDTTFAPKENITRAQVATMLVRILDVMEKEEE
ncbi:MAG: S-layer homology domain-containing protein [Clostridia bacterium]|nr:S-layer homology domain-containing protein [Clostridia bacterium]